MILGLYRAILLPTEKFNDQTQAPQLVDESTPSPTPSKKTSGAPSPLSTNSFWSRNKNTIMLVGTTAIIGAGLIAGAMYLTRNKNST
jgi:hypothetical protein